jgi:hypothetical protein
MNWFDRVILRKDLEKRISELETKVFKKPDVIGFVVDNGSSEKLAQQCDDTDSVPSWMEVSDAKKI